MLQRKRKLCLAETLKTGTRQAVLGIRISEFKVLNGAAIDHIQQIIPSIGGIPKQSTRKFLADGEEVSEEEPKITEENVAQYSALLWPLKAMDSLDIIQFSNRKFYCILADCTFKQHFFVD